MEVEAVVADYFDMLEKELAGIPYSKTEHRRALRRLLPERSEGSIERKHQNISAVLIEAGHPYISGYKPLSQYQQLLADVVLDRVDGDAGLRHLATEFAEAEVQAPVTRDLLSIMKSPPNLLDAARFAIAAQQRRRVGRMVDYLAIESRNRAIGREGEALVVRFEKARLDSLGHGNLAEMVEHIAATRGDGLGYDVLSFFPNGKERFIEVKTTQLGAMTPFYLTENEVAFSSERADEFSLYRIYNFRAEPSMFALDGALTKTCTLRASQFVGVPAPGS